MRYLRAVTAAAGVAALAGPVADAVAAARAAASATVAPKKTVVTKKVTGPQAAADQWGYVQVVLTVRKTTTIVGSRRSVTRKIVNISIPVYPNHTDRSVYISNRALPWLMQETMKAQSANIQMITGASNSSDAYVQSLQGALALEKRV